MPTQVQHRPSESLSRPIGVGVDDPRTTMRSTQQQQQIHREALRLALGSILTPKRPPFHSASRSSSGTASPAFFGSHSASGAHTPAGTPPVPSNGGSSGSYYPLAHGPNSSEYLHPHHAYGHGHHGHSHPHGHTHTPLPPSRLSRSTSSAPNSPTSSVQPSAPASSHPSPMPGPSTANAASLPTDIEPLPPAALHSSGAVPPPPTPASAKESMQASPVSSPTGSRPNIMPLQDTDVNGSASRSVSASGDLPTAEGTKTDGGRSSGTGTPRAKFLQTLQSKSAWDALIHGSFS